jgi:hypothetical protein
VRIRVGGVVVPLALITLAACGSGASTTKVTAGVIEDGAAKIGASTAHLHMTKVRDAGGDSVRTFVFDGDIDGVHHAAAIRVLPDDESGGFTTETRAVGGVLYERFGPKDEIASTPWYRMPSVPPSAQSQLGALSSLDPFTLLDGLADVAEVKTLATGRIDGVPVTHVHVTVDAPPGEDSGSAVFDLWVDAEGRIRRLRSTTNEQVIFRTQIDFTDFGAPVTIEAPPASEVVDVPTVGAPTSG